MTPYLRIPVTEASQVGEARRAAARLAADIGLDATRAGQLALSVTELGNNLARHATGGRILLGCSGPDDAPSIDVISVDSGPGMPDLPRCMTDGYSTGGTPGTGLGAVKRLSDSFSAYSTASTGTVILSRIGRNDAETKPYGPFEVSGITLAAPGEHISGDGWSFRADGNLGRVLVADGLGHGPDAAAASDMARACFDSVGGLPSLWMAAAHAAMRSTRGAAVAMAELDAASRTITFAGAGNIAGRVISGVSDRSLVSQHGTVGLQIRKVSDVVYPWPEHACLVLHSDGITGRWSLAESAGLLQCDVAVIAAWLLRDHSRGRDDATVVVVRCR